MYTQRGQYLSGHVEINMAAADSVGMRSSFSPTPLLQFRGLGVSGPRGLGCRGMKH